MKQIVVILFLLAAAIIPLVIFHFFITPALGLPEWAIIVFVIIWYGFMVFVATSVGERIDRWKAGGKFFAMFFFLLASTFAFSQTPSIGGQTQVPFKPVEAKAMPITVDTTLGKCIVIEIDEYARLVTNPRDCMVISQRTEKAVIAQDVQVFVYGRWIAKKPEDIATFRPLSWKWEY